MHVRVAVVLPDQVQIAVPETALVRSLYGDRVFVLEDGEPIAVERYVQAGLAEDGRVGLTEGVRAGESVVVQGAFKLYDGAPVSVVDGGAP